jgi:hypothetical protein
MKVNGQLLVPAALHRGKNPGTHSIGGLAGSTDGLDVLENRKIPAAAGNPNSVDQSLA